MTATDNMYICMGMMFFALIVYLILEAMNINN